jgi:hypothetical protein
MSYFDIYRKRVNRYGNNLQERIQGKKEHDFEVFMSKSPNQVTAWDDDLTEINAYKAVLQTKEYDQDEVVDYLLVPLDRKIPMGTVIYTKDARHKTVTYEDKIYSARRWINYAIDPYTSTGYNRYTVVELESELSWVLDGIKYTSFAHATGGGSGARDKNINLKFKTQFSEAGVYLPNKRYSIVMPTHPALKKNMKITLGGETWRVTGFDNISVKGVSYVTLEEALTDEREDIPVANYSEFKNWTITTNLGENFVIPLGTTEIKLIFYYKDTLIEKVKYFILENDNYSTEINENFVKITTKNRKLTNSSLKVIIEGWDLENFIEIPFKIGAVSGAEQAIIGSKTLYVNEEKEYIITNCESYETGYVSISNSNAVIKSFNYDKEESQIIVKVKGENIGSCELKFKEITLPIEVKSMWLGGNK